MSGQLKKLRWEVKLCEDISVRSGVIKEKMQAVRENEKSNGKEIRDRPSQQKPAK